MKKISIAEQYQLYLKRVGLKESMLSNVQNMEMKRAFYGSWGQLLILLREDIADLKVSEGIEALEDMKNQVASFWMQQIENQN